MFIVQDDLAPCRLKLCCRIGVGTQHAPQGLCLHNAFRRFPVDGRFQCGRSSAIFPVRCEITGHPGHLLAVPLFKGFKGFAGRRQHQFRPRILGIPGANHIRKVRIRRAVVSANVVPHMNNIIGEVRRVQLGEVVHNPPAVRHFSGVEPGIGLTHHPAEHFFLSRRRHPVEGFVAPGFQGEPDAMSRIRSDGHILHAALRQHRDQSPGIARHIGDHGGVYGHARLPRQPARIPGKFHQFLGTAQRGQFVAIQRVQAYGTRVHRVQKGFALFRCGALQITVYRPQSFRQPLEAGTVRVVLCFFDETQRCINMLPLHGFHIALQMRVADIQVGVGHEVDCELAYRLQQRRCLRRQVTRMKGHLHFRVLFHSGRQHFHCLHTFRQFHGLLCTITNYYRAVTGFPEVANRDAHYLPEFAVLFLQQWLGDRFAYMKRGWRIR